MSMILEVPVPTTGYGIRPRCRKRERIQFVEYLPVEVRSLTPGEAPVIMQAEMHDGRRIDYRRKQGDDLGGSFWAIMGGMAEQDNEVRMLRPIWPEGWNGPVTSATVGKFLDELVVASSGATAARWGLLPSCDLVRLYDVDAIGFRSFEVPDRDADHRQYLDLWRRAAFIDDILHVPSAGPAWECAYLMSGNIQLRATAPEADAVLRLQEEAGFIPRVVRSYPPSERHRAMTEFIRNAGPWVHNESDPRLEGRPYRACWSGKMLPAQGSFRDYTAPKPVHFPATETMEVVEWLRKAAERNVARLSSRLIRQYADLIDAIAETDAANARSVMRLLSTALEFRDAIWREDPSITKSGIDPFVPLLEIIEAWKPGPELEPPERNPGIG